MTFNPFSIKVPLLSLLLCVNFLIYSQVSENEVFACDECDHIVSEYYTDGDQMGIAPGDVVCLVASRNYSRVVFRNINGTKEKPVIIRNCGGQANIYSEDAFGMKFENSKHLKIVGDGSEDRYGIKITTEKGFFLTLEKFTTDFEITRVEIAGATEKGLGEAHGFAGIGVKTSPYQDCELFTDSTKKAWTLQNVSIHENYIHDTGGEGIYMGHGFYMGRKEKQCPEITYAHSIEGVEIYNNLIENVGYDGIQIKNADKDVSVHHNLVRNYGTRREKAHDEGLFIGEGTTGAFYENIIDTGNGNGCQIQGIGNIDLYNNLILNSGKNGIYAASGYHAYRKPDGYFNIHDNIIFNSEEHGFVFYNDAGGLKTFKNNQVIKAGTLTKNGAKVVMVDNVISNDPSLEPSTHEKIREKYSANCKILDVEKEPVE